MAESQNKEDKKKVDGMSDEEIMVLIKEYGLTDKDFPKILNEITDRDFESVLRQIEEISGDRKAAKEREKALNDAKKHEMQLREEAEYRETYRKMLLEKIEANREEMEQKNLLEAKNVGDTEKTVSIDADIKVKALINGKSEIILGFKKDATINDLFEKLYKNTETNNITVKRFGHSTMIEPSDKSIQEYFDASSIMIDVEF